jgi:short-subunit dehydrogenase
MKTPKQQTTVLKTVVITGASSGAGRAIALEFAKCKASLVLASRNVKALQEIAGECMEFGANCLLVQTDVTDMVAMQQLAAKAIEFAGAIDVWVNNAGVLAAGAFTETPLEVHHQVIKTNLLGYIYGAYAVLPYFKTQKHGVLINNISVGAFTPIPYGTAYSASKFGLQGFFEALQAEFSPWRNIHICNLYPPFLDTPGIQHAGNYTGKTLKPAPPVYDPLCFAKKVVAIAIHPRQNVTIGSIAYLLKAARLLAPGLSKLITFKVIDTYLKTAKATAPVSGNLFEAVEYGNSIYGGWSTLTPTQWRKDIISKAAIIAALTAGMYLMFSKK